MTLATAGSYSVILSNSSGTVTAAVATVNVGFALNANTGTNDSANLIISPYQAIYASNSTVKLTAIPKFGWVFDSWSGDYSGTSNSLTVIMYDNLSITANLHYTNPPPNSQTVNCSPGTALSFNGNNQYVSIGAASLPTPWTAEFWVNRKDASDASATLLGDNNTALKLEQYSFTRRVGFTAFGVADYLFNYTVPTNTWVHLAFVCDTDTRLYVNGVIQDTNAATIPLPLGLLGDDPRASDHLKGSLDEVRVWNYARGQSQIQANMNRSVAAPQPGLVGYWRMDEGTGLMASDASGGAHAGTLSNGVTWVASTIPFVPCVTTFFGTAIDDTTATLNGSVTPNGSIATNWFEYGGSTNYSGITSPLTNSISGYVSNIATRLPPGTLCHFRLAAMNSAGINFGEDATFITPARLRVAPTNSNVLLAWPASTITFNLQRKSGVTGTNWVNVTNSVSVVSNENQVTISPLGTNAFYRLKYP